MDASHIFKARSATKHKVESNLHSEAEAAGKAQIITETHDKKFQLVKLLLPSVYKLGERCSPVKWLAPSVTTNREDGEEQHCLLTHTNAFPTRPRCRRAGALRTLCTQVKSVSVGF